MIGRGNVAKGQKYRIARVVVHPVKVQKLVIAEVGNVCWIAAAVVVIGVGWVQVFTQRLPEGRINRAHSTLHFVEYHAFKG